MTWAYTSDAAARPLVETVQGLAESLGLAVGAPRVLSVSSNIVIHLAPAPVVARVANVTAMGRDRPERALAREVALSAHLDSVGVPVIPPSDELPPGPHVVDGWAVSFLRHEPLEPLGDDEAAEAGTALAEWLAAAAGFDDPDGLFDRTLAREVDVLVGRIVADLAPDDARRVRDWVDARVVVSDGARQPLHGDPHRRNVGRRADGAVVYFDLDDGVADDPRTDLAVLLRNWPEAGRVACAAVGVDPDGAPMARLLEQREMWGRLWTLLYAAAGFRGHDSAAAEFRRELGIGSDS